MATAIVTETDSSFQLLSFLSLSFTSLNNLPLTFFPTEVDGMDGSCPCRSQTSETQL